MSRKNWLFLLLSGLIFLLYFRTLAPGISWEQNSADSAELALAAAEAGIAHPPGYPTYILLAHLWQKIPFAQDIAYRLNLLSSLCTVFAVYILMRLTSSILEKYRLNGWGAVFAGIVLGTAPLVWSQAVITEVYAMALAFLSLIFWLFWGYQGQRWRLVLLGFLLGAAYGVMPSVALAIAPIALVFLLHKPRMRELVYLLGASMLGLAIFLYLPLRSAMNPVANWGRPATLEQFWWMLTAGQYQQFWNIENISFSNLGELFGLISLNLQYWGFIPAFVGFYWLFRHEKAFFLALIGLLAVSILQFLAYRVEGYQVYSIPALFILVLLMGIGLSYLLQLFRKPMYGWALLLCITTLCLIHIFFWYPYQDRSEDSEALHFATETLEQLPDNAVIISHEDATTFALWYGQKLLQREDIVVIDSRLLLYDWYIDNLIIQHPELERRWLRYGGLTGLANPLFEIQGEMNNYIVVPIR